MEHLNKVPSGLPTRLWRELSLGVREKCPSYWTQKAELELRRCFQTLLGCFRGARNAVVSRGARGTRGQNTTRRATGSLRNF